MDEERTLSITGALFADGGAVDLLRNARLVYWNGEREQVREEVCVRGLRLLPAKLDADLDRALRLPAATKFYIDLDQLIGDLISVAVRLGFAEGISFLIGAAVLATWVPECFAGGAPVLNFWGPPETEGAVPQVISAISRRPLHLADASVASIAALPKNLHPTVIVVRPSVRALTKLINGSRGAHVIRAGSVIRVSYSVIAFTDQPFAGALNIPLIAAASRAARWSTREVEELAAEFQPRLVSYRLRQHSNVARSACDAADFAPETKRLARALGATLESAPELQGRVLAELRTIDEQVKVTTSAMPAAIVVESLLVACRENCAKTFLSDVTELANTILIGRHEPGRFKERAVGAIVRDLGFLTKREGPGYVVALDNATRERIRELGRGFGVLSDVAART